MRIRRRIKLFGFLVAAHPFYGVDLFTDSPQTFDVFATYAPNQACRLKGEALTASRLTIKTDWQNH